MYDLSSFIVFALAAGASAAPNPAILPRQASSPTPTPAPTPSSTSYPFTITTTFVTTWEDYFVYSGTDHHTLSSTVTETWISYPRVGKYAGHDYIPGCKCPPPEQAAPQDPACKTSGGITLCGEQCEVRSVDGNYWCQTGVVLPTKGRVCVDAQTPNSPWARNVGEPCYDADLKWDPVGQSCSQEDLKRCFGVS